MGDFIVASSDALLELIKKIDPTILKDAIIAQLQKPITHKQHSFLLDAVSQHLFHFKN
jgi:hypothetical protein